MRLAAIPQQDHEEPSSGCCIHRDIAPAVMANILLAEEYGVLLAMTKVII
jgi:hypothetical protein